MFNFIKNIFKKSEASQGCCGGGCCSSGAPTQVALGVSDGDLGVLGGLAESLVIGKILTIAAHPDPKVTKVRVTQVDLGGREEQILCGGANIEEGQIVPIALIGTDLGGGFVIAERDIRGEVSRGMICARQELGLEAVEAEKGGIWPLPAALESRLGMPLNTLV